MRKAILITVLTLLTSISFAQDTTPSSGNTTLDNAMNKAKNSGGDFNSKVSNPFAFCSAPKPSKRDPMRIVWDQICPAGNTQAAAAPVPVPTGNPTTDTKALQDQFNKTK